MIPPLPREMNNYATNGGQLSSRLELLGGFGVFTFDDPTRRLKLPLYPRRLLALLAVAGITARSRLAGALWPQATDGRAFGNLRTAVWQMKRVAPDLISVSDQEITLHPDLRIDLDELRRACRAAMDGRDLRPEQVSILRDSGDLLPGWYDDWVIADRDDLAQLRVSGLECLATKHLSAGLAATALPLALAAVGVSPLHDSAHRLVVEAHLRQGNSADALHHFDRYRRLLQDELRLSPSLQMRSLISPLLDARSAEVVAVVAARAQVRPEPGGRNGMPTRRFPT